MPDDDDVTEILPALKEDTHPVTVVAVVPERAVDLTAYVTPGLPPPAGLNDLGVAWSRLDPGVIRTYNYLSRLPHRPSDEVCRRAAVLLTVPEEMTGTPVRCHECHRIYVCAPDATDWGIAGREDGLCFNCTVTMPPPDRVLEGTIVEKPDPE